MKTKKFFSIIMGIMLLATSNVYIFAENLSGTKSLDVCRFEREIEGIDAQLSVLVEKVEKMYEVKSVTTLEMLEDLKSKLKEIVNKYHNLSDEMLTYSSNISNATEKIAKVDRSVIGQVTAKHLELANDLTGDAIYYIDDIIDNMNTGIMSNSVPSTRISLNNIYGRITSLKSNIITNLNSERYAIEVGKTNLFKALETVTKDMPKEDIYNMIVNTMSESDRAGINLIMQAREEAPSARKLAKGIQSYLKEIGLAKPGLINRLKLIKDLKRIHNVDGRIEYVSKATRLDPLEVKIGTEMTGKEFVRTERGLSRILKSAGPMIAIGAVLTAVTIVDVNAQNVFPKGANSARRMASIKKAIENDLDVSVSDALDFYVGHFDENESVIENSNAHYMNMVRLLALTKQANDDKDKIFNILEKEDPSLPDVSYSQAEEITNALDKYLYNNLDKEIMS